MTGVSKSLDFILAANSKEERRGEGTESLRLRSLMEAMRTSKIGCVVTAVFRWPSYTSHLSMPAGSPPDSLHCRFFSNPGSW